jgi:DNA polymerase III delta subunit
MYNDKVPQFDNIQNNAVSQFRQILTMGSDPNALINMILQSNPQLQIIANQMQQSKMTPTQYILQMARQNNVPINEQMINQMMNSLMGFVPRQR